MTKYQKAIELDPKFAFAYDGWGNALEKLGRNSEAREKFEKLRKL
ncbi:MAG: tetratricopeptide repeat protein [Candidatus Acidiferrales bacterium]